MPHAEHAGNARLDALVNDQNAIPVLRMGMLVVDTPNLSHESHLLQMAMMITGTRTV